MSAIDDAIYETLTAASGLTDLLNTAVSVYPDVAPEQADLPYVVYAFRDPHEDHYVFTGRSYETYHYAVQGIVGPTFDSAAADAISTQIDLALSMDTGTIGAVLLTKDYSLMRCRRETRLRYPEKGDSGDIFYHAGGVYVIEVAAV